MTTNCVTAMTMPSAASMARRAIELSNKANADPSFADEACKLWSSILNSEDTGAQSPLPLGAMPAAHALHASTLVRVGRDKEAITEYKKSMAFLKEGGALSKPLTKEEVDIRMGMGNSLQRMLQYDKAAGTFLRVATRCEDITKDSQHKEKVGWVQLAHSDSVQRSAICYMRVGDLDSAISILEKFEGHDAEVDGMLGALLFIQMQTPTSTMNEAAKLERIQMAKQLLHDTSSQSTSPLYSWIHLTSQTDQHGKMSVEPLRCGNAYLTFAKINNCPFDDPGLINLDDKILFHSAVMNPCLDGKDFWPQGYILPSELDSFRGYCKKDTDNLSRNTWILKEKSGYGSHGNSIASNNEVLSMYDASDGRTEPILCQRIVEPPMLIDGRKFSLRIYVIYFPGGKVLSEDGEETIGASIYVSSEGLVKYARASYVDDTTKNNADILDDQYMTNSGRGDGTNQNDLQQLQRDLHKSGINYQNMWKRIERSVQIVMKRYVDLQNESSLQQDDLPDTRDSSTGNAFAHRYAPLCSIPKIMGFDYILDSSANPFLLEVNRFPGLEPRSSTMDADVKHSVVYDAWVAACDRIGVPKKHVQILRPRNYKGFSLKEITNMNSSL